MATMKIPATYVADFRTATITELRSDCEWVIEEDTAVRDAKDAAEVDVAVTDRQGALDHTRGTTHLLAQVPDQDQAATIQAPESIISPILEQMSRLMSARIEKACLYAPMDFHTVETATKELTWIAGQVRAVEALVMATA